MFLNHFLLSTEDLLERFRIFDAAETDRRVSVQSLSRDRALQSVVTPDATTVERILNLFRLDGNVMERDGQAIDTQGPWKKGVVTLEALIS